ncbi:MAG TPA: FecR domain-containing protein [Rhizomicrobium sp.]|nr:FecR domain-containing protein [Rhizomicrobium sp.]
MPLTSSETDDLAAEWAAKRNLRDLTPAEQAEFDAWLVADRRNLGAYGRAEAVLARLERVSVAGTRELSPDGEIETPKWPRRRVIMGGSIAAGIAVAVFAGTADWRTVRSHEVGTPSVASYSTGIGQTREILLSDGSIITLNTDSRVSVEYSKETRKIQLARGEALFDVAKNKLRPFIVFAGDAQVRAVGTSFTVSMLPRRPIQVLVKEGIVELKRTNSSPLWVGASTRALAPRGAPIVAESISSTRLANDLAWQYGHIALENRTLQEAADEFSRYSELRIVVDPAVANRTITGMFASNDPVAFARAAAAVLKLRVDASDGEVRISASPDKKG